MAAVAINEPASPPGTAGAPDPTHGREAENAKPTNELAIASMCLGVLWVFGLGSLVGLILGMRSLRQIRASDGTEGGRSLAIAGVVISAVGLASGVSLLVVGVIAAGR